MGWVAWNRVFESRYRFALIHTSSARLPHSLSPTSSCTTSIDSYSHTIPNKKKPRHRCKVIPPKQKHRIPSRPPPKTLSKTTDKNLLGRHFRILLYILNMWARLERLDCWPIRDLGTRSGISIRNKSVELKKIIPEAPDEGVLVLNRPALRYNVVLGLLDFGVGSLRLEGNLRWGVSRRTAG